MCKETATPTLQNRVFACIFCIISIEHNTNCAPKMAVIGMVKGCIANNLASHVVHVYRTINDRVNKSISL